MPAAVQRSISSVMALAVSAMIGTCWLGSSRARISRVAVRAVHDGHLHVHEHEAVLALEVFLDAALAVLGDQNFAAEPLQEAARHLLIHDVVFDDEHAAA